MTATSTEEPAAATGGSTTSHVPSAATLITLPGRSPKSTTGGGSLEKPEPVSATFLAARPRIVPPTTFRNGSSPLSLSFFFGRPCGTTFAVRP